MAILLRILINQGRIQWKEFYYTYTLNLMANL